MTAVASPPAAEVAPPAAVLEAEPSLPSIAPAVASAASDAPVVRSRTPSSVPQRGTPDRISDSDLPPVRSQRPRWVVPLVVAAVIGLGVVGLRRLDHAAVPAALPPAAEAPKAAPAAPLSALPATDVDDDTASPAPTAPAPLEATPAPSAPVPSAVASADRAAVGDLKRIRIASNPPGARMFWRGKEVGTTPFTLELQPGEKHYYELGLPGYVTRKVVIDGSKSEISIGMKPESRATTGANPRK